MREDANLEWCSWRQGGYRDNEKIFTLLLSLQFYLNPSPVNLITKVPAYVGNAHM